MPSIYAFDIDDTIEQLGGPVTLSALVELRADGHVVGLCGNWAAFCRCFPDWWRVVSFMNVSTSKETLLLELREQLPDYDDYVLVGNIPGVSGASDDAGAAARAGWRFIKESEFAGGAR
jgi:hypothetical protein